MTKRQVVILFVASIIVMLGVLARNYMATPPEKPERKKKKGIVTVFAEEVELKSIPVEVVTTGSLEAFERMELYSEVQGVMLPDDGKFKSGNSFSKGETILRIRSDDARAAVVGMRSTFERTLSSLMADIRIDFPKAYDAWSAYLRSMDVESGLADLPVVTDDKLKSYLTGRSVFAEYYNVRNAEIALSRYRLTAPFTGELISADVDPGTVVRPGQLLGVFVKPGIYEFQASAIAASVDLLTIGQDVTLTTDDGKEEEYAGEITRINTSINAETQMVDFFVEVKSLRLREGQYMKANVRAGELTDAFEMDRSSLKNSRYTFVIEDGKLVKRELTVLHTTERTAVVRGLKNGEIVLSKLPPTAFEGMDVVRYGQNSKEKGSAEVREGS